MRSFVAKRFETRPAGLSLDTEALARYADVIDLSIGDTDFTTDKRIIDAAYADACAGYTHYGDPKGDPELIAAIRRAHDLSSAVSQLHSGGSVQCRRRLCSHAVDSKPGSHSLWVAVHERIYGSHHDR